MSKKMNTNVKKNSQPASQLQQVGEGEIVLYQLGNNIRLEVQLHPQVKVRENRTTTNGQSGATACSSRLPFAANNG